MSSTQDSPGHLLASNGRGQLLGAGALPPPSSLPLSADMPTLLQLCRHHKIPSDAHGNLGYSNIPCSWEHTATDTPPACGLGLCIKCRHSASCCCFEASCEVNEASAQQSLSASKQHDAYPLNMQSVKHCCNPTRATSTSACEARDSQCKQPSRRFTPTIT